MEDNENQTKEVVETAADAAPVKPVEENNGVEEAPPKENGVAEAKDEVVEATTAPESTEEDDLKKNEEVDQSSTSSSPSALHIHLDDEDKDAESLNDKEVADPSLPLISNVVSLSNPPDLKEATSPPSPTPSGESGPRRATLRFKRGIEISFDVDQNGQPVTVNNHEPTTSMPSEPRQKRSRMEEEEEENQPDLSELDMDGANTILAAVQKDIRTLRFMAKQKEKEWNYILKLMKVKEELQAKLMRRREVLKITSASGRKNQPVVTHPGAASLQSLINQSLNSMMQNNKSPRQNKMNRQRPILPKPSQHPDLQMWNHHVVESDPQGDARNRQGTVSVQSLIADYRAKHPEEIPTRGRRIRQPSRLNNDPNSSSSPPPQPAGPEAAGMSFKDVLLQFAKMSSRQGHPVDIMGSKESLPGSSSAAALQNLAAARNARSSPAGSILQNALSGSRTNPSFAPTLAQLLTNPGSEQPAQPPVSIPVATTSAATMATAAASAEVLTLSNLLATAKGHVTITSDRVEQDDVTVVGGTSRNASSNGSFMRTSGGSEVPKCQGCNERVAQFVCAGCSSQWYCSRECQVAAWEEHSEHCVG